MPRFFGIVSAMFLDAHDYLTFVEPTSWHFFVLNQSDFFVVVVAQSHKLKSRSR